MAFCGGSFLNSFQIYERFRNEEETGQTMESHIRFSERIVEDEIVATQEIGLNSIKDNYSEEFGIR